MQFSMATFKIYFNPQKAKKDGRFVIYVLVRHHRKQAFINSNLTVNISDLIDGELSPKTRRSAERFLESIELRYKEIHYYADTYDIKKLIEELQKENDSAHRIDFYDFVEKRIEEVFEEGRDGTAKTYVSLLYALKDYREYMFLDELTLDTLLSFEKYLRSPKVIKRKAHNTVIERTKLGFSDNAIIVYMQRFKAIYNELRRRHDINTPNPFERYKFGRMKDSKPRDLPIELLREVSKFNKPMRYQIGLDCFLLSLYFCGINLADLFETARIVGDRLEYNRKKTKRSRPDEAFSSIQIQPEAKYLISRYTENGEFVFNKLYPDIRALTYAVNKGLRELCLQLKQDPPFTYYQARHSVATIMSNDLDIPDSHVKMVLNHNLDLGITNKYIKKDFSKIDRANRKFLDYLFAEEYEDLI